MRQRTCICQAALLLSVASSLLCNAFTPAIQQNSRRHHHQTTTPSSQNKRQPAFTSPLWQQQQQQPNQSTPDDGSQRRPGLWRRALRRLDTIRSAPGPDGERAVLTAGLFGKLKKLHDPITYFVVGILAGFRWDWCFKSPLYWFAIGFTIKWYRARHVFKIPVWDRQPNWNNIVTSKEQEKDLKALTCKNCGSTIFIAKTREFFFEGDTGIGGLGCFACGAKGKDNFVEDRDRIVEDVGDMDDYFEYERPLDFVSRAERRKLLKEAEGDEEKANQLLLERETGPSSSPQPPSNVVDAEIEEPASEEKASETVDISDAETEEANNVKLTPSADAEVKEPAAESPVAEEQGDGNDDADEASLPKEATPDDKPEKVEHAAEKEPEPVAKQAIEPPAVKSTPKKETPKPKKKKTLSTSSPPKAVIDLDGLDELDMDAF